MKHLLNRLINQESISSEEAKKVLVNISNGMYNQSQIASFLTVYMMRSITLEELQGFRDALLELCIPINLEEFNAFEGAKLVYDTNYVGEGIWVKPSGKVLGKSRKTEV